MKLSTIRIEKFRAIRKAEICVGNELALVGQNSSGKSSILRAINAFFNYADERSSFEDGRHRFQKSSTASIELTFSDVPSTCTIPRSVTNGDEVLVRLRYKRVPVWEIYTDDQWTKAHDTLHEDLQRHIRYVYVPLRRDHEISAWGDGGLLNKAVEVWVQQHTSKRDRISPKVAKIAELIQRRAFSGLSKQLRKVTPIDGKFEFSLEYTREPNYALLLRDIVLRVTEGNTTVDLQDCGSGTQSMAAFALYSYLAELEGSTYILGIEEPEQNLHPQAQRALLSNLRKLPLQVLFTTHSTVLLDDLSHEEVVLCRRVDSTTRGIEITTTQLRPDFWASTGLDKDRYYQFYKRRNSEFFFANFVILTESPIDAEIVREILRKAETDAIRYGVSILSLDGVLSLPYAYQMMKALDMDFATIVDKDYFVPYINDDVKSSIDNRGFPRYRKELKKNTLVESMFPDSTKRNELLEMMFKNHSKAMNILQEVNVFCFKWSLEVDLVNSATARTLLFQEIGVPLAKQNTKELLVENKKKLKKLETLLPVLKALKPANLPNSYKRLRRVLPPQIKRAASLR